MSFTRYGLRFTLCGLAALASVSIAGATISAQVVQLPSTYVVGGSSVIEVPDSGTGILSGIGRTGATMSSRGPGLAPNRGVGSFGMATQTGVTATIIDLEALDEAIRNASPSPSSGGRGGTSLGPLTGTAHPGTTYRNTGMVPGAWQQALSGDTSIARELVARNQLPADVLYFVEQAERARALGRYASAEVYYKMAVERLPKDAIAKVMAEMKQKEEAKKALEAKSNKAGTKSKAGSTASTPLIRF